MQAVLPEAVDIMNTYEETEKQRLGLRYTEVIPLLTAALQEAVAEIDTLKTKVAALLIVTDVPLPIGDILSTLRMLIILFNYLSE